MPLQRLWRRLDRGDHRRRRRDPVYIAEEYVISASVGEDDAECEGFACSDCGRAVSLPPGYTFQRP
jgi:hypothetical protein